MIRKARSHRPRLFGCNQKTGHVARHPPRCVCFVPVVSSSLRTVEVELELRLAVDVHLVRDIPVVQDLAEPDAAAVVALERVAAHRHGEVQVDHDLVETVIVDVLVADAHVVLVAVVGVLALGIDVRPVVTRNELLARGGAQRVPLGVGAAVPVELYGVLAGGEHFLFEHAVEDVLALEAHLVGSRFLGGEDARGTVTRFGRQGVAVDHAVDVGGCVLRESDRDGRLEVRIRIGVHIRVRVGLAGVRIRIERVAAAHAPSEEGQGGETEDEDGTSQGLRVHGSRSVPALPRGFAVGLRPVEMTLWRPLAGALSNFTTL